jgi:hypothetical protein
MPWLRCQVIGQRYNGLWILRCILQSIQRPMRSREWAFEWRWETVTSDSAQCTLRGAVRGKFRLDWKASIRTLWDPFNEEQNTRGHSHKLSHR